MWWRHTEEGRRGEHGGVIPGVYDGGEMRKVSVDRKDKGAIIKENFHIVWVTDLCVAMHLFCVVTNLLWLHCGLRRTSVTRNTASAYTSTNSLSDRTSISDFQINCAVHI